VNCKTLIFGRNFGSIDWSVSHDTGWRAESLAIHASLESNSRIPWTATMSIYDLVRLDSYTTSSFGRVSCIPVSRSRNESEGRHQPAAPWCAL
jgi:hypothetical protein